MSYKSNFRRLIDLDFEGELKKARRSRECSYIINEVMFNVVDNKWLKVEKTNVFGDTCLISHIAKDTISTFPVMPSMYSNVYTVQFYAELDTLVKRSLQDNKKNNIDKLIFHSHLIESGSPHNIRMRVSSKRYLKFFNSLQGYIKLTLEDKNIPVNKETISLTLAISYFYGNFMSFANSGVSEDECIQLFFDLYFKGVNPALALKGIIHGLSEEAIMSYVNMPEDWIVKVTDLDLDIFN